jgi:putative aminopeptidase FrvX
VYADVKHHGYEVIACDAIDAATEVLTAFLQES